MINEPTIFVFWTALIVFVLAVIFELYTRTQIPKKERLEKPHSKRIHKALEYFKKHETKKITNDLWQKITKVSHVTAVRDLSKLVEIGILKKQGRGRGVHYIFIKHTKK